jgi:hypothetical protein
MKTYNFNITRTYETNIQLTAENEQEARLKLNDIDIYEIELEQCNVIEEKIELEHVLTKIEKAVHWFQSRNIEVSFHTSLRIVMPIIGLYIEVSDAEIEYRASLWDTQKKD